MNNFITFESPSYKICFGDKSASLFSCEQEAQRPIIFGHQVHGCTLVDPSEKARSAHHSQSLLESCDALFVSNNNKLALGVYTADCIPCFIVQDKRLFSLHLGWRGIYSKLLSKILLNINTKKEFQVFLGPHIQASSFEVKDDLVKKFEKTFPNRPSWLLEKESQFFISLKDVLKNELKTYKQAQIQCVDIDTFKNKNFHSYRRDSSTKERNLSFAFLK